MSNSNIILFSKIKKIKKNIEKDQCNLSKENW